jgi:hypothetical protein
MCLLKAAATARVHYELPLHWLCSFHEHTDVNCQAVEGAVTVCPAATLRHVCVS